MKKVLKSRIFVAIITAIVCITGTAYAATQILAGDIKYKNSTVEDALDDLYAKTDKLLPDELTIKLRTESYSNSDSGTTNYNLDTNGIPLINNYKYFKITGVSTNANLRVYSIWGYDKVNSKSITLSLNTEYDKSKISNIWVVAYSKSNGQMGYVIPTITFYNNES